jgi:hypothetical protein
LIICASQAAVAVAALVLVAQVASALEQAQQLQQEPSTPLPSARVVAAPTAVEQMAATHLS